MHPYDMGPNFGRGGGKGRGHYGTPNLNHLTPSWENEILRFRSDQSIVIATESCNCEIFDEKKRVVCACMHARCWER